eukprot:GHVL01013824.1.p1 GENE.GHVL01013824.1~~GHVL01013824.1.p1  ORF type:complete len:260 (+),score=38.49 GHVL01013824.1:998-1777(+)
MARLTKEANKEKQDLKETIAILTDQLQGEMESRLMLQDNLKRVFMRGVCALNLEAMNVLSGSQQSPTNPSIAQVSNQQFPSLKGLPQTNLFNGDDPEWKHQEFDKVGSSFQRSPGVVTLDRSARRVDVRLEPQSTQRIDVEPQIENSSTNLDPRLLINRVDRTDIGRVTQRSVPSMEGRTTYQIDQGDGRLDVNTTDRRMDNENIVDEYDVPFSPPEPITQDDLNVGLPFVIYNQPRNENTDIKHGKIRGKGNVVKRQK